MMGDRERCIQAQMDEYLSKPLHQNHLIQTILKCATLGGALLEKNRERELEQLKADREAAKAAAAADGASDGSAEASSSGAAAAAAVAAAPSSSVASLLRPTLGDRAVTSLPGSALLDSPALLTVDEADPMTRARSSLSEPAISR
jgi:osomolarity two-component system, sensor histidine kinase NIK1